MTNRPPVDWEAARADYEALGKSQVAVAKKYGISRTAVQKHIKAEGWQQDVSADLDRAVAAKVAGVVAGGNPKKRAEAVEAEADRRATVVRRHRDEWDDHKMLLAEAIADKNFEAAKLAKITAETITIRQQGERKAWGLDKPGEGTSRDGTPLTFAVVNYADAPDWQPAKPQ